MKNPVTTIFAMLLLMVVPLTATALSPGNPASGTATVIRVIDGDTYDIAIQDPFVFRSISRDAAPKADRYIRDDNKSIRVRLNAVDTAELSTPEGRSAAQRVRQRLEGEVVRFRCFDYGYYGRVICHINHKGNDMGHLLIEMGLSRYIDEYGRDPFLHDVYRRAGR